MSADDAALINYIDTDQLKKDLAFDMSNLSESMTRHAALFIHYAQIAVRARAQSDRWKSALEVLESQLDNQYRTALKEENPKTTEPMIRAAVVNDPKWKAASARLIDAQTQHRLADAAERAFEHRKDMMLQIARNQAKEMEGSLRATVNGDSRQRMLEAMQSASKTAMAQ